MSSGGNSTSGNSTSESHSSGGNSGGNSTSESHSSGGNSSPESRSPPSESNASGGSPGAPPPPSGPTPPPPPPRQGLLATIIARPVTASVGLILVILAGIMSVAGLPIQLTPDVTIPTVTVTTRWPGSSPAEVEAEILEDQEEALKSVVGLDTMESEARPDQ